MFEKNVEDLKNETELKVKNLNSDVDLLIENTEQTLELFKDSSKNYKDFQDLLSSFENKVALLQKYSNDYLRVALIQDVVKTLEKVEK